MMMEVEVEVEVMADLLVVKLIVVEVIFVG